MGSSRRGSGGTKRSSSSSGRPPSPVRLLLPRLGGAVGLEGATTLFSGPSPWLASSRSWSELPPRLRRGEPAFSSLEGSAAVGRGGRRWRRPLRASASLRSGSLRGWRTCASSCRSRCRSRRHSRFSGPWCRGLSGGRPRDPPSFPPPPPPPPPPALVLLPPPPPPRRKTWCSAASRIFSRCARAGASTGLWRTFRFPSRGTGTSSCRVPGSPRGESRLTLRPLTPPPRW